MQAKKLNDKMLQYILAKCGCEMLTGSEAAALKDHILALEAELGKWPACRHGIALEATSDEHGSICQPQIACGCFPKRVDGYISDALAAFREANPTTKEK